MTTNYVSDHCIYTSGTFGVLCVTGDETMASSSESLDDNDDISRGAIAGIVVGIIVGLILVVLLAIVILYFIKTRQEAARQPISMK